jgi:hypothetical protein
MGKVQPKQLWYNRFAFAFDVLFNVDVSREMDDLPHAGYPFSNHLVGT